MKRTTALLSIPLSFSFLMGCTSDSPKARTTEQKADAPSKSTNEHQDPNYQDCAAITDPAQAENCRMWKGIAAAKKKHSSEPAVKHNPGSIQQP